MRIPWEKRAYDRFKEQVREGRQRQASMKISLALVLAQPELRTLPKVQEAVTYFKALVREEERNSPRHRFADDGMPCLMHTSRPSPLVYDRGQKVLIKYAEDEEVMRLLAPYWGARFAPGSVYSTSRYEVAEGRVEMRSAQVAIGIPLPQRIDAATNQVQWRIGDNFLPYTQVPGDEALVMAQLLEKAERIWGAGKEWADEESPGPQVVGKSTADIEATLAGLLTIFAERAMLERKGDARIEITAAEVKQALVTSGARPLLEPPEKRPRQ